jgi:hypothetical protein
VEILKTWGHEGSFSHEGRNRDNKTQTRKMRTGMEELKGLREGGRESRLGLGG